jgi:hypothetical protein
VYRWLAQLLAESHSLHCAHTQRSVSVICRATAIEGGFLRPPPSRRLDICAFYLCLSSCSTMTPVELTLAYHPAIGDAALGLNGRALPPAAPAKVTLRRVAADAYASADRVAAAEVARFVVLAATGEEVAAKGVFSARREGVARGVPSSTTLAGGVCGGGGGAREGWRADAGQGPRGRPRPGRMRCGATRLEGIPEEDATTGLCGWCRCECDDDGWEVVGDAE